MERSVFVRVIFQRKNAECDSAYDDICAGNVCTCPNGVAQAGAGCPVHGGAKCVSCNRGWTANPSRTECLRACVHAPDIFRQGCACMLCGSQETFASATMARRKLGLIVPSTVTRNAPFATMGGQSITPGLRVFVSLCYHANVKRSGHPRILHLCVLIEQQIFANARMACRQPARDVLWTAPQNAPSATQDGPSTTREPSAIVRNRDPTCTRKQ